MVLEIIITAIFLGLCSSVYFYIIQPKKRFDSIGKQFEEKGFTVYKVPFTYFAPAVFNHYINDYEEHGDALKMYKEEYSRHDIAISNVITTPMIEIINPQLIKQFYAKESATTYPKREHLLNPVKRFLGQGLILSQGSLWKTKRKLFNRIFNYEMVRSLTYEIAQICDDCIVLTEKEAKKTEDGYLQYNIFHLTCHIFSHVIMESFLGGNIRQIKLDGKPSYIFFLSLLDNCSEQMFDKWYLIFGLKFLEMGVQERDREINRKLRIFKEWGRQFIKERMKETREELDKNPGPKVAKKILEALALEKQQFTEDQILDDFSNFFMAGTDTTARFLQAMICEIVKRPHIQKRLREEIDTFMKEDDYSYENLKNFRYIECLQKEMSRFYGPINELFVREAAKDHYLGGVHIRKGTYLNVVNAGHFNAKYFKDPFEFRPERWEGQCDNLPPFVHLGFSGGPRSCLGKHLALLQSKIGLIKFMKRYKEVILPDPNYKMKMNMVYSTDAFQSKLKVNENSH